MWVVVVVIVAAVVQTAQVPRFRRDPPALTCFILFSLALIQVGYQNPTFEKTSTLLMHRQAYTTHLLTDYGHHACTYVHVVKKETCSPWLVHSLHACSRGLTSFRVSVTHWQVENECPIVKRTSRELFAPFSIMITTSKLHELCFQARSFM